MYEKEIRLSKDFTELMGFEDVPSQKRNIALLKLMKTVGLLGSKAPSKVTLFFFFDM